MNGGTWSSVLPTPNPTTIAGIELTDSIFC